MPGVLSRPEDVTGASSSSSTPAIIDLHADYKTIEKNIVSGSRKDVYEKKLIEMMLFFLDNNTDMLHDELVPKMVACKQEDLARPTQKTKYKSKKGNNPGKKDDEPSCTLQQGVRETDGST